LTDNPKIVVFFSMRVESRHKFYESGEIDEVAWVPVSVVVERLSHEGEGRACREIIELEST
jgi:hypothetical protein